MRKRKAIFAITQWSRAGGLEIVTQDYVKVFRELGFDVTVLAANGWGEDICEDSFKVEHLEPKNRILRSVWHRYWKYRYLAKRVSELASSGDIVIVGHAFLMPMFKYTKIKPGVVSWLWTHGVDAWGIRVKEWNIWQDKLTRVIAVSEYTAEQEISNGISRPVSVISNCVDVDRFTPSETPEKIRRNEIAISSRLTINTRNKGHDILFKAVPLVESMLDRCVQVRVVGTGPDLENVQKMAEQLCPGRVEFMGRVSEETLLDIYRHCGCFCMPSRVEFHPETKDYRGDGFGLVYAEVQACGRPAVGSTEGGAVDPIEEGVTGYKVDPRSPAAVAEAIVKLLKNPENSDEMGRAGRRFVIEKFSPEAYRQRILSVLAEDGIVLEVEK